MLTILPCTFLKAWNPTFTFPPCTAKKASVRSLSNICTSLMACRERNCKIWPLLSSLGKLCFTPLGMRYTQTSQHSREMIFDTCILEDSIFKTNNCLLILLFNACNSKSECSRSFCRTLYLNYFIALGLESGRL